MPRIAIVDDAEDHREVFSYLLRDQYEVVGYESGAQAIDGFSRSKPDLIIMDIRLEDMDGTEVLRRIRAIEELKDTPVIALTANAMKGDRERCLNAGFNEYISKPLLQPDQLLHCIQSLIAP
jgi:two-component system chemotaxis sensor kinase CheA